MIGVKKAYPWEAGGAGVQLQSFRAQVKQRVFLPGAVSQHMVSEPEQHNVGLSVGGGKMV